MRKIINYQKNRISKLKKLKKLLNKQKKKFIINRKTFISNKIIISS